MLIRVLTDLNWSFQVVDYVHFPEMVSDFDSLPNKIKSYNAVLNVDNLYISG